MIEYILKDKRLFLVVLLFFSVFAGMSADHYMEQFETAASEENAIEKIIQRIEALEEKFQFTGYVIDENINLFYIDPVLWNSLDVEERKTALMSASRIVLFDKMLDYDLVQLKKEEAKTKIYSEENKQELLAEVRLEAITNRKGKIKRNKKFSDAYRFYDAQIEENDYE